VIRVFMPPASPRYQRPQMIDASSSIMPIPIMRHPVLRFTSSDLNRVFLSLRFELLDECSEMPGHRTRKGVVLVLQALPDC
jgi:hypothetical protein